MAIWPFNRNKQDAATKKVPREVEQYYQSEHRDRVGVAWLLAGLTLVITVLIVLGLFFSGRWVYRKIANKDDNSTQTAQTNQPAEQSPSGSSQNSDSDSNSDASRDGGSSNSSTSSSSTSSTNTGTVNAPTQTNSSTPATQPTQTTNSNLANTGPGQTVAIFVLVSVAGYLGYSEYLRRKLN